MEISPEVAQKVIPPMWGQQLKVTVKGLVHIWIQQLNEAVKTYEDRYGKGDIVTEVEKSMEALWNRWITFRDTEVVTGSSLAESPLFHNFDRDVYRFLAPRIMGGIGTRLLRDKCYEIRAESSKLIYLVIEVLNDMDGENDDDIDEPYILPKIPEYSFSSTIESRFNDLQLNEASN